MKHFSPSKALFVVQADDLGVSESNRCLKWGKIEQARHARTLFDDGRKRGLLCIALCKAQSKKFLPRRFCHESKSEIVWNPRLLWARAECGPDARRWTRPAGRHLAGVAAKEAKRREGECALLLPLPLMGRVLLKVLSFFLPLLFISLTPPFPGYHSRRQWVSLSTFHLLVIPQILLLYRVGKTSLMNQYVNKRFSNQYKATIGADLYDAILL